MTLQQYTGAWERLPASYKRQPLEQQRPAVTSGDESSRQGKILEQGSRHRALQLAVAGGASLPKQGVPGFGDGKRNRSISPQKGNKTSVYTNKSS